MNVLSRSLRAVLCLLLGIAAVAGSTAEAQVVFSHNFDTDIDGWIENGEPGLELAWVGDDGDPAPGAIAVRSLVAPPHATAYQAWGSCFDSSLAQRWILRGRVKKEGPTASRCYLALVAFTEAGCTGERSDLVNVPDIPPDLWIPRQTSLVVTSSIQSFRPALTTGVNSGGQAGAECRFDSIDLVAEGASPIAIPSLSSAGLILMPLVISLAAIGLLRPRRRSVSAALFVLLGLASRHHRSPGL